MKNRWSKKAAKEFVYKYFSKWGEDLALRIYSSRLIGVEKKLVLYGGGNTSVKTTVKNIFSQSVPVVFVKASGYNLADIGPEGYVSMDLEYLKKLVALVNITDESMVNELLTHRLDTVTSFPSIETLMHAFIPPKYIDHTHPSPILALTNQKNGKKLIYEALGDNVIILDYKKPGFLLAKTVAEKFNREQKGMILMKHGLLTWGETARESYERTIEIVNKVERYLHKKVVNSLVVTTTSSIKQAKTRYLEIVPILRGLLAVKTDNPDRPFKSFILRPLITNEVLEFLASKNAKQMAVSPPLTADYLIRTKSLPLWIDNLQYGDMKKIRESFSSAISNYNRLYNAYFLRHRSQIKNGVEPFDAMPRVILIPGVGAICAGEDVQSADIVCDIVKETISVKKEIIEMGGVYKGLNEQHIFEMEYFSLQRKKLKKHDELSLQRSIAVVTGAAGAIGSGICEELLKNGCHVVATDINSTAVDSLVDEMSNTYGKKIIGIQLDVTDPKSVKKGFNSVVSTFGGIDIVILNAGIAYVSSLEDMDLDNFRKLEKVNIEGTLNILSVASKLFNIQGTGGDVILISTKNVFAPGAKFGAYSATKAAAHQLARIASLEFAEIGVRVNMVSPDAVFAHGKRRSGLWLEVGPDRMRARGLNEKELEEYYRNRNLLKARVTATHVAKAVMFFATHQTPTTGATIPVDGGLPNATPR